MVGALGCGLALCLVTSDPPIQRPKSLTQPPVVTPAPVVTPSEPDPIEAEPAPPPVIEPAPPPVAEPTAPREPGTPPSLPEQTVPAPSEPVVQEPAVVEPEPSPPPPVSDPFSAPAPAPTLPGARTPLDAGDRRTVDPFSDGPAPPKRDGKALIYGGVAFTALTIAVRVPVTTRLSRVGNPYDMLVYGNVVNVVAIGAITTLVVGAVRRGHYLAYQDVFVHGKRRRNAKAFTIVGWSMFGAGLGAFLLSRVLMPLSCDLVNSCDLRGTEAAWYLSFAVVAAGAGLGSFGAAYGDRARNYEQRHRVAVAPWFDRSRAGVGAGIGVRGRF